MSKKQPDPAFNQTEVTLRFLANSVYQDVMENKATTTQPSRNDYKFYRKRAFAMMKDMMRGNYPSEHLKTVHMNYVNELINYMKVQDTSDILQKDYPPGIDKEFKEDIESKTCEDFIEDANKLIMKDLDNNRSTIDDFVIKKIIKVKEPLLAPTRREANISTSDHKTKGLKKKSKRSKNLKTPN